MDDKMKVRLFDINPDQAKKFAQRLHRKKDDIEITRKAAIVEVSESSDDDRTIVARVSTPDRDRDGEIIEPKGIDLTHYNSNPVLMWAHDYKTPPIGRAMWSRVDDRGLLCKFEFAKTAFADEIYTLYRDGFLKTFSIGFIPVDFDGKTKTHQRTSLLEVSACPIPSDPFALVEAEAKGLVLCDSLKHDLGLDGEAAGPLGESLPDKNAGGPVEPDTKEGVEVETFTGPTFATLTIASDPGDSFSVTSPAVPISADVETAPVTEKGTDVPEASTPAPPADKPDLAASLRVLMDKVDALAARLAPAPVVTIEPLVITPPADFIAIDPEQDVLAGIESPAPVAAQAPKSIETMTEAQVIAAVGRAVDALDVSKQIKELVDLSLDKMRGRVR